MEIGMIIKYGAPVHGREKESLALFDEVLTYGKRLLDEGKVTYFEPFLLSGGDLETERGFFIIRGPVADMFGIIESEEYRSYFARSVLVTTHVHSEMLAVGDTWKQRMDDWRKAVAAAGV